MVELAEVDRALQAVQDGRQAAADAHQPRARPIKPVVRRKNPVKVVLTEEK